MRGIPMRAIVASSGVFNKPNHLSGRETEILFGEAVHIHSRQEDWCDITLETDGYRGWVLAADFGVMPPPTHHVTAARTVITAGRDVKTPYKGYLPLGALVHLDPPEHSENEMAALHHQHGVMGYIPRRHVTPIGESAADYTAIATSLIAAPYLWGGRDSRGLDCSALIQLSLGAAGLAVPRNTGDQEKTIGTDLDNITALRRGDLVFWRGHVGVMTDADTLLHANAHHGMVAAENLSHALPRLEAAVGSITRLVRLNF